MLKVPQPSGGQPPQGGPVESTSPEAQHALQTLIEEELMIPTWSLIHVVMMKEPVARG